MNGIRACVVRAGIAGALMLALAGCPPVGLDTKDDPAAGADGARCGTDASAMAVYIDIRYDATGMPSADPENCEVAKNAKVTWRGPEGNQAVFRIDFKNASPVAGDVRGVLVAEPGDDRYRVVRQMGANPGTYPYGIQANGKERDPAIIIR